VIADPVIPLASGEAKNKAAFATSFGVTRRFKGYNFDRRSKIPGSDPSRLFQASVCVVAGTTEFARIP